MSKQTLTQWFTPEVKPARKGVYEVKCKFGWTGYSQWDGYSWGTWSWRPEGCQDIELMYGASKFQSVKWRGLAEKP